ncbi:MAG: phosphatidate cytidylyltransferase [Coriobacteriia bacterium]|nr:phosphatidate cytidylyltransferase [Coriobacteriia bacterium]
MTKATKPASVAMQSANSAEEQSGKPEPIKPTKGQPAGIKKTSLIQRIITGFVFVTVVLICIFAGGMYGLLPMLLVIFAVLGVREFCRIINPDVSKSLIVIGSVLAASMPVLTFYASAHEGNLILGDGIMRGVIPLFYVLIFGLVAYMVWVALTPESKLRDASVSFFAALYLGIPLSSLMLIRGMGDGVEAVGMLLTMTLVVSIWATDSFAYLGGSLFGRNKIAPTISPKKSWEGLTAGTLGAILIWYLAPLIFTGSASLFTAIIMGLVVSIVSLIGDLFQSRIKREAGVKDSGTLLPGHGGILDRIDSLLLTAPVVFLILLTAGTNLGLLG